MLSPVLGLSVDDGLSVLSGVPTAGVREPLEASEGEEVATACGAVVNASAADVAVAAAAGRDEVSVDSRKLLAEAAAEVVAK